MGAPGRDLGCLGRILGEVESLVSLLAAFTWRKVDLPVPISLKSTCI